MHFSTLFIACALYFCIEYSDAKFAEITSVVTSVVQKNLNSHSNFQAKLARNKRAVTSKILDDEDSCVYTCFQTESEAVLTATRKNIARLVGIALQDIKGDELDTPEKEAEFEKKVEAKAIANMGPMFEDYCKAAKEADQCYSKCPASQLRKVVTLHHTDADVYCEPSKSWNNFSDYWTAINCTNTTESEKPCEKKCGSNMPISNATHLEIHEPEIDGTEISFESDVKKNNLAVGAACKIQSCEIDCYKPLMTEQCGQKAYNEYVRTSKIGPKAELGILKELKAIDDNKECKEFQ